MSAMIAVTVAVPPTTAEYHGWSVVMPVMLGGVSSTVTVAEADLLCVVPCASFQNTVALTV